jgi:hypothetical protein
VAGSTDRSSPSLGVAHSKRAVVERVDESLDMIAATTLLDHRFPTFGISIMFCAAHIVSANRYRYSMDMAAAWVVASSAIYKTAVELIFHQYQ